MEKTDRTVRGMGAYVAENAKQIDSYKARLLPVDYKIARHFHVDKDKGSFHALMIGLLLPLILIFRVMVFWVIFIVIALLISIAIGIFNGTQESSPITFWGAVGGLAGQATLYGVMYAANAVFQTLFDLYAIIIHPLVDLFPLLFGAPFSPTPWNVDVNGVTVNLNSIVSWFYVALIVSLLFKVRVQDTLINKVIGNHPWSWSQFLLLGVCVGNAVFAYAQVREIGADFSYARSIADYLRTERTGSYLDLILTPTATRYIGSTIDPAVHLLAAKGWSALATFWGLAFLVGSEILSDRRNALEIAGYAEIPDFLVDIDLETLDAKLEMEAQEEAERTQTITNIIDAVIESKTG